MHGEIARTHFHAEEYLLRKHHFIDLENHLGEHRLFLETLSTLLFETKQREISAKEFSLFLGNWLKDHILESDMTYKSIFN
jgi:hemerythrin-like metal-binding protein